MTYADKQAMLARGEAWLVHPREVAKLPEFHGTDPEIILACILEAGVLDTGEILKTAIDQRHGLAVTDEAKAAYEVSGAYGDNRPMSSGIPLLTVPCVSRRHQRRAAAHSSGRLRTKAPRVSLKQVKAVYRKGSEVHACTVELAMWDSATDLAALTIIAPDDNNQLFTKFLWIDDSVPSVNEKVAMIGYGNMKVIPD